MFDAVEGGPYDARPSFLGEQRATHMSPLLGQLTVAVLLAASGSDAIAVDAGWAEDAALTQDAAVPTPDAGEALPAATARGGAVVAEAEPVPPEALERAVVEEPAAAPETDDPATARQVEEASRELEELRQAEAAVVDEGGRRAAELFRALGRSGAASPLHQRLRDALTTARPLPLVPDEAEMEAAALAEIGSFDLEKARRLYDIPVEMQPLVAEFIRFFQGPGRKHFVRWLGRASHYLPMMKKALREAGLPEDTVYLSMIESGFAPVALSKAKAMGLWQFIEPTGKRFGLRVDFWEDERRDPVKSTYAAAGYLKELYTEFGDWRLAWAGYNSGAGTVRRAIAASGGSMDFWTQIEAKRAYKKETKHYVPKLMAAALISKHLKHFGFQDSEIVPEPELAYEEAEVPEATDLDVIARAAGTTVEEVKALNPSLRRWCTPPGRRADEVYRVHLPVGTRERFVQEFPKIAPKDRMNFVVHLVARGDTLSKIAQRYGSATEAIMRVNGLRDSRHLRVKSELVVPVPRGGGVASREALALSARKQGFKAAPVEQEVPAEPPAPRKGRGAAAGSIRTVQEGGRTKTIYGVAEGDSLWSISRQFKVKIAELRAWNGFEEGPVKLRIGQEIAVFPSKDAAPTSAKAPAAKGSPPAEVKSTPRAAPAAGARTHVVEQGDSLWSIAQRYQVSVDELRRWNNLRRKTLKLGQTLSVKGP